MNSTPALKLHRPELKPSAIATALAFAEIAPPNFTAPFCVVEIGNSAGQIAPAYAADYPHGQFISHDVQNFDIARDIPSTIDVLILNQAWSHIDAATRSKLTALMTQKLKPQGVLVIDYATPPGAALPQVLHRYGLELAAQAQEAQSLFFKANPYAVELLEGMQGRPLGTHLQATSFQQMHDHLGTCGLTFAGAARMADAIPKVNFSTAAMGLLQNEPDVVLHEMKKDMLLNRGHRCDLFVRAPQPMTSAAAAERIARTVFAPIIASEKIETLTLLTAYAEIKLNDNAKRVFGALKNGPASAVQLAQRMPGFENIWATVDAMVVLMAMDAISPQP